MPFENAPGVYVQEVAGGARPIGAVGTSTAAFVGAAPDASARLGEAVAIGSWTSFVRTFANDATASTALALAVHGFFENGGGRCYVVNTPDDEPVAGSGRGRSGLRALEAIDEVAILAAPGRADADAWDSILGHCERLEDRVAVLDTVALVDDVEQLTRVATAAPTPTARRRGAADAEDAEDAAASSTAEARETTPAAAAPTAGVRPRQSPYGACYFPHIVVRDPLSGERVTAPPKIGRAHV